MQRRVGRRARRGACAALAACALAALPAAAAPGAAAPAPPGGSALAVLGQPPARTSLASQRIYHVFPDRYANGDPANDRGGATGQRGVTGYDPTGAAWFHGGDYRGLTGDCANRKRGLARIEALGFTAVLLPSPVRQKAVQGAGAAYHGSWGVDFTTVDPHLGTEADFAALVACAHELGLKVYLDVSVNHTADVIRPLGGTAWVGPATRPYRDCEGRVFDPDAYVLGLRFPCLDAAKMPRPPSVAPAEKSVKKPDWLNDVRRYHNRGDADPTSCNELCVEQGDLGGLDDLFTEQPAVARGLADLHADWIEQYGVDGFRVTAARHLNPSFFAIWVPQIRAAARAAGVKDFELFGDARVSGAVDLAELVRERGLPSAADLPLQESLVGFVSGRAGAKAIAARLEHDDYFQTPAGSAHTPPTLLGDDALGRGAALIRTASRAKGDVLLGRVLLGYDLLYLLRGAPVVLYGDELGLSGAGGGHAARQDLFPTKVRTWQSEERVGARPIGTRSSFDVSGHPVARRLQMLGALRGAQPALSTGAVVVRRAARSIFAFSRIEAGTRRELIALFNSGATARQVTIRTATPSSAWRPLLGTARGSTNAAGDLAVAVPPLGTVLLRADGQIPAAKPETPVLRVGPDEPTGLLRLDATPGGSRTVSVAFAVKGARTGWRRLGVDDSFPYRGFLDPADHRRGEAVHVVAIARGLDGSVAVSPVQRVVVAAG